MFRGLDWVYWLVGSPYVKEQIIAAKTSVRDTPDNYQLFVDAKEYQLKGWDAQVTNWRSENLFTIRENMRGMVGEQYGEIVGKMWGQSTVPVHYDRYKVLGKSCT